MRKWKPIDTAPKDGTTFWAHDPKGTNVFTGGTEITKYEPYQQVCWWGEYGTYTGWMMIDEQCGGIAPRMNPTLWAPLPKPPKE